MGGGVPPPLKIHKLYGFLLKIVFGSPTLEKVGPLENGGPPGLMMELSLKPGKSNFLLNKTIDKQSDPLCKL